MTTIPDALINVAVAILRVQRRLVAVAAVTVTGAAITIGGALLLWLLMPHLGITGAGWAALASAVILATTLAVMWHYRSLCQRAHRAHRRRFTRLCRRWASPCRRLRPARGRFASFPCRRLRPARGRFASRKHGSERTLMTSPADAQAHAITS